MRARQGQNTVEMALLLPVLLLLLMGLLDFARVFRDYTRISNAAREAAIWAAYNPGATSDEIVQRARNESGNDIQVELPIGYVTKSISGIGDFQYIQVTTTIEYHPLTPIIGRITGAPWTLRTTVSAPKVAGAD
jgi:Flp pilus assembly protein TadG